ncbi:MAG: 3-dehydroquinate synthase family protein [Bdellovibrionota bacterium]
MMSNGFISPFKIISSGKIKLPLGRWALIYDKKLQKHICKISGELCFKIPINAGEGAKSLKAFEGVVKKLARLELAHGACDGICVLGGGSLGDMGAFVASVYRRGVRLILVPSTYLSVIDSAFGGKTALNFGAAKNQIGTFYPAESVLVHKQILPSNTQLVRDAYAELLKTAILERGLWNKMQKLKRFDSNGFWKLAEDCILAKLKIVKKDPRETKGLRQLLNLGHTLGHVFEKIAPLSHGEAVALGLFYELEIFYLIERLDEETYLDILELWEELFSYKKLRAKLMSKHSEKRVAALLLRDKKAKLGTIQIPVVNSIGKVAVEKLPATLFLQFLKIQGITR